MKFGHEFIFALNAVNLVDNADGGQALAAHMGRKMLVQRQQAVTRIHHKGHGRGINQRRLGLRKNIALKAANAFGAFHHSGVGVKGDAARVNDTENGGVLAAHHAVHAVAGHAGAVMGDGPIAADKPVEQGGFAHIGATHQNDAGQCICHENTLVYAWDLPGEIASVKRSAPPCGHALR